MKKLDLVKYIELGAKNLAELQKGAATYTHRKFLLRKAVQEVVGVSYNKALFFATDVLSPIGDDLKKVANRYKASELEAIAKHFDNEIIRVKAYLKEHEGGRTVFFSQQEKNHYDMQQAKKEMAASEELPELESGFETTQPSDELVAKAQAEKFEDEISRIALYDTREIDRIVYESDSVKVFNSESPYGKTFTIATDGKITRQYIRDDIMNKHATAYKLNERIYKLVYSPFCTWFVYVS